VSAADGGQGTGPPGDEEGLSAPAKPVPESSATDTDKRHITSSQVSWWSVHEHVAPTLTRVQSWPTLGTLRWVALDDSDPAKLAALLDAAQHWALRLETCQEAQCDASREISDSLDWSALAREIQRRRSVYIPRKVA
jgi:hypothetical protein